MRDQLTGRVRYRKGWRGRVVLQVEVERRYICPFSRLVSSPRLVWRDAKIEDMTELVGIPPIREGREERGGMPQNGEGDDE